jgi:hypothetical protein
MIFIIFVCIFWKTILNEIQIISFGHNMRKLFIIKLAFKKKLVTFQFKIKIQVKGLTHMFCLQISSHKLYKGHIFHWLLTKKCICQFDASEKMLNIKW